MKSALYFADDQVSDAFFKLKSGRVEEKEIFNQLNTAFDMIAMDPFCGIQVPKRLIPKVYITKYGIDNLWKFNFHKNWRLMYSVAGDGTHVVTLVLEWLPHKEYERRSGIDRKEERVEQQRHQYRVFRTATRNVSSP